MLKQVINAGRLLPAIPISRGMCKTPSQGQGNNYLPNKLEKKFLIWTGKYKTMEEVPNLVSAEVMERSRNKMRIRIANIMMVLTVFGCIFMVYSGKKAAKEGDSVTKQNIEWHERYNKLNAVDNKKE